MARIGLARSELPQAILVWISTLAGLALLAWALAYWSWVWWLPRPQSRGDERAAPAASAASAAKLFGVAPVAAGTPPPAQGLALKLQGVVAATGSREGYAVVQIDAKKVVAVHQGEELAPGISLAEVHAEHIVVDRAGSRETLAWPPKSPAAPPAPLPVTK